MIELWDESNLQETEWALKRNLPRLKREGDPHQVVLLQCLVALSQVRRGEIDLALESLNDLEFTVIQYELRESPSQAAVRAVESQIFEAMGWSDKASDRRREYQQLVELHGAPSSEESFLRLLCDG